MSEEKPRSVELSQMKVQQAEEHSSALSGTVIPETIGKVAGFFAGRAQGLWKNATETYDQVYESDLKAGRSYTGAAVHGVIEAIEGQGRRTRADFGEMVGPSKLGEAAVTGFKEGLETGRKAAKIVPPSQDM